MIEGSTVTSDVAKADSGAHVIHQVVTHLYVVLDCERPHEAASRFALDGIDRVNIGRGERLEAMRSEGGTELFLRLPDSRTSREHARLTLVDGRWIVEDLGAKNGTWVSGRRVDGSTPLTPGAIVETGHTFLMLRFSRAAPLADAVEVRANGKHLGMATLLPELVGRFTELTAFAKSSGHVAILGETGSGKDVLANTYHQLTRRSGAFVPVNCGGLPPSLLEPTLFGHKKGAYSGATTENQGLVRAANGGTLFLDEIGDLPLPAQAALLRVLEAREVLPVGASTPIHVDVRIVSATHRDIPGMVAQGEFREDLWARLSGFVFKVPPLRDRLEDLGLLVSASITRHGADRADRIRLSITAGRALMLRRWPHNVRELMNAIAHALAVSKADVLGPEHLPEAQAPAFAPSWEAERSGPPARVARPASRSRTQPRPPTDLDPESLKLRAELEELLYKHDGNVSRVAETKGWNRTWVYKLLHRLKVNPAAYRPEGDADGRGQGSGS